MNTPSGACIVAAAAIFILDLFTPLGITVPMLYVVPILFTWLVPGLRMTAVVAGNSLLLTWLGVVFSAGELTIAVAVGRTIASVVLLIVAVLVLIQKQSARRISVMQQEWKVSEERFRKVFEHAAEGIVIADDKGNLLQWNAVYSALTGYSGQELAGRHFSLLIHPDDRAQNLVLVQELLEGKRVSFDIENRYITKSGSPLYVRKTVSIVRGDHNQPLYIVALVADISQRKRDEEELHRQRARLEELASRLLIAQDDECRRIARELHDDHMQRLAALALDLHQLSRSLPTPVAEAKAMITHHARSVERLTADLQQFVHGLHPSMLAHLGLEATVQEHVEEFERRTGLKVELEICHVPAVLSDEQSVCLFRVLQECLQNVRKHANARKVLVRLLGTRGGVGLCVHDDGRGFEASQECTGGRKGLGLISLGERLGILNGTFRLRTKPGDGTEVHAWIPLEEGKVTKEIGAEL